jgi:hypothetical protein
MPRKSRKAKKMRQKLSDDQLNDLVHGWSIAEKPFESDDHRRELYFKHKDYLFSLAGQGLVDGLYGELKVGKNPAAFYNYERR